MKYIVAIFLYYSFTISILNAQTLEVPEITSVSVDTISGKPIISWEMQNPDLVDGYIIKRLFVDGTGVISGTYNNVAVIESNNIFSFLDDSNAFGTEAKPELRNEFYRISSYKVSNGQTHYSLMSEEVSTITFSGSYDDCWDSFNFNFSQYSDESQIDHYCLRSGFQNSENLLVTQDNFCSYKFDDYNPLRNFCIECVLKNGESSFSPIIYIESTNSSISTNLEILSASINADYQLELALNIGGYPDGCGLYLLRQNTENKNVDTLILTLNDVSDYHFVDETADVGIVYNYKLLLKKSCGSEVAFSNIFSNDAFTKPGTIIYVPNALNPKSSNFDNCEFKPKADFLTDYKLVIYDKRGEIVFESDDLSKGWDGYNPNGNLCPRDTYVYQISYKDSENKSCKKTGTVNLVY